MRRLFSGRIYYDWELVPVGCLCYGVPIRHLLPGGRLLESIGTFKGAQIPVGEKWNVHAEYFGIFSSHAQGNFSHHFSSFGGHVLLSPDLDLGIRFGFGLDDESARFLNNAGVAWRF